MNLALIEYNFYHDEVLPTWIFILNQCSIKPDIYTSQRAIEKNPFFYTNGLDYSLACSDGLRFRLWERLNNFRDYDFIILNSLEPEKILNRVERIRVPIIAVVHNGDLVIRGIHYKDFFAEPGHRLVVLSEHIARSLSDNLPSSWIAPVYLGEPRDKIYNRRHPVKLCVQGNLEFGRRNHDSLLDAIAQIGVNKNEYFVKFVGRNDTKDGRDFKNRIKVKGIGHLFEFSEGELSYKEFYDAIFSCDFILPLIDKSRPAFECYYSYKITSSVSIALALGIVPIIHRSVANLYNIEDFSLCYEDGELSKALKKALHISNNSLEKMRKGLLLRRQELLCQSVHNFEEILKKLNLNWSR